ncbi:MAG: hypothetical protein PF447_05685, partial [Spirochaetaceae bacterium]|nr:hypothetical protein [Spirochaetaceae bacterium]
AGEVSAELLPGDSLSKEYPTERFRNIEIESAVATQGFASGDRFLLEWYDGSQWQVAKEWIGNGSWKKYSVNLPQEAEGNEDFMFRFRADVGSEDGRALLDDVSLNMEIQL